MNPPASSASATALPFRPVDDNSMPSSAQWGVTLVLCTALLGVLLLALKRRGGRLSWRRKAGLANVLERHALLAQTQLVVVSYAGRRLLLSVGPAGTQCLRDDPEGAQP